MITAGDSTTYNNADPANAWRNYLATNAGVTNFNASFNGRDVQDLLDNYDTEIRPHTPYITNKSALATVLIGNNDLNHGDSGATIYTNTCKLFKRLRLDGCYIYALTVTPSSFQPSGSDWDNRRLALNALHLANSFRVDGVYNLSNLLPDPTDPILYLDGTHYTIAGNQLIANTLYNDIRGKFDW